MPDKPAFDPSKPFNEVTSQEGVKPPFNPNKPFIPVGQKPDTQQAYLDALQGKPEVKDKNIAKVFSDKKDESGLGEDLFNSLARGSARLGSMLAKTPAMIYDIAATPFNYVASGGLMEDLQPLPNKTESMRQEDAKNPMFTSEKLAESLGIKENKVAKYYDDQVKQSQEVAAKKYDKGISEYFGNGEYKKGFGLLANSIAESAPITVSLLMGNAAGVSTVGSILGGGAVFAADKKAELDEQAPNLDHQTKMNIAMSNGLFEGIFEQFGITKLGGLTKNILARNGKEEAKKIAEEGFKEVYAPVLKRYVGTAAEESLSEAATQFAQNAVDKYSGYKPDLDLREGVVDAAIVGLGSSGVIATPTSLLEAGKNKSTKKEIVNLQKERIEKETERNNYVYDVSKSGDEKIKSFVADVESELASGKLTQQEADNAIVKVNAYKEYHDQTIDLNLPDEEKKQVFDYTFQKSDLLTKLKNIDKDKLNAIELAKYHGLEKQAKDLQGSIDDIILKAQLKNETTISDTTIDKQAKAQQKQSKEEKKPIYTEEEQAVLDKYKKQPETGKADERTYEEIPLAEFNSEKFNARTKHAALANYLERIPDKKVAGKLVEKQYVYNNKQNSTYAVQLPDGKVIKLASSMERPEKFRGHMRTEHLVDAKDLVGFPVGVKVEYLPEGKKVIKLYNGKTGKFISWAKETTRGIATPTEQQVEQLSHLETIKEPPISGDETTQQPEVVTPLQPIEPNNVQTTKPTTKTNVSEDVNFSANSGNKVVDEKGNPLTVYHGTKKDFKEFDETKIGGTDDGWYGKGFYFHTDPNRGGYGDIVKSVNVNLKNPIDLPINNSGKYLYDIIGEKAGLDKSFRDKSAMNIIKEIGSDEFTNLAKELGYDGVITNYAQGTKEIVAFDKSQIKILQTDNGKTEESAVNGEKPTQGESSGNIRNDIKKTKRLTVGTKKANRKIKDPKYIKALSHEVFTPHELAMQYFIGKGLVNSESVKKLLKSGKEVSARMSYVKKDAPTINQIAEKIVNDNESLGLDMQDVVNAVEDIITWHNTPSSMAEVLNSAYNIAEQEFSASEQELSEGAEMALEAGLGDEFDNTIDIIEELPEGSVIVLTQEDINKIIEENESDIFGDDNEGDQFQKPKGIFNIKGQTVFYHASNSKRKGDLKPSNAKQFGTGVYFSTNKDLVTEEFGDEVTEVELRITNPVYAGTNEWSKVEKKALENANKLKERDEDGDIINEESDINEIKSKYISDAAKELGYDAIIDEDSAQYENEIVVLDESKIIYGDQFQKVKGIRVFHGGYDLGEDMVLKLGHFTGKYTGSDSGAIFFTPSEKYARQYMKHPEGLYEYQLTNDKIFDITDANDLKQLEKGFTKNWEDEYSSKADAISDYKQAVKSMQESVQYGAVDWATASQFIDQIEKAGFEGAKFLERAAENIENDGEGFKTSGPPVYSYAIFKDNIPVEKIRKDQFQKEQDDKNLLALHNISADQILSADKLGAMITPSIAIIKKGHGFSDFGNITLMVNPDMVSPEKSNVKVFKGDVYSPTVPRASYHIDKKLLDKRVLELTNKAYKFNHDLGNYVANYVEDFSNFYKDLGRLSEDEIQQRYKDELKIVYLIDKGIDFKVPYEEKTTYLGNIQFKLNDSQKKQLKPILDKEKKETEASSQNLTNETRKELWEFARNILKKELSPRLERYKTNASQELYDSVLKDTEELIDNVVGEKPADLRQYEIDKLWSAYSGKKILDRKGLDKNVIKTAKEYETDYKKWLSEFTDKYQGDKYFEKGRSKLSYTLDNLVEATIGKTRGQEEGMTYGMNKAKSFALKKFSDLSQIKKQHTSLISKEEMTAIDKEMTAEHSDTYSKLKWNFSSTWGGLDAFGKALADYYKGASAISALRKNDFNPDYGIGAFKEFADKLASQPVDYFEAKMQRAVKLNEFPAAVVPKDTPQNVLDVLAKNNVEVYKYNPNKEGDRKRVTDIAAKKHDIHFQKAKTEKGNIELSHHEKVLKVVEVMQKALPNIEIKYNPKLKAAGVLRASGKTIEINPYYAGLDTPIHEAGHVLIDAMGYDNKVIQAAIKQLLNTKLADETKQRYPELSEEMLGKEILAEAIGREGAGIFETESEKSKFKQYLDYIFNWFKRKLGMDKNIAKSLAKQIIGGIRTKNITGEKVTADQEQEGEYLELVKGFYSPIEKTLRDFKLANQSATKWLNMFGKGDEMMFTGLRAYLESKKPDEQVKKQELIDFIRNNRIQIKEVVKGKTERKNVKKVKVEPFVFNVVDEKGNVLKENVSEQNADDFIDAMYDGDDSKFSQYQLEGEKEGYKEVLITIPSKEKKPFGYKVFDKYGKIISETMKKERAEQLARENEGYVEADFKGRNEYKSSHFDEANIVVHLRMNIRKDADGNKVLFVEEIQSDYGQEGKKKGFKVEQKNWDSELGKKAIDAIKDMNNLGFPNWQKAANAIMEDKDFLSTFSIDYKYAKLLSEWRENAVQEKKLPSAPYVTDTNSWAKLGLKVALQHAVQEGASKIAWTTGEQQNDRYDLSKQVDKIEVEGVDNVDGLHFVDIYLSNGTKENLEVENGTIREGKYSGQRLDSVIGKDYADKVLSTPKGENVTLKGDDLKVGGKGMIGFYGSPKQGSLGIIGGIAEKLFGKGSVKTTEIQTKGKVTEENTKVNKVLKAYQLVDKDGDILSSMDLETGDGMKPKDLHYELVYLANKYSKKLDTNSTQYSVDVTPEMELEVQRGLPQFQKGKEKEALKAFDLANSKKGIKRKDAFKELKQNFPNLAEKAKQITDNFKSIVQELKETQNLIEKC